VEGTQKQDRRGQRLAQLGQEGDKVVLTRTISAGRSMGGGSEGGEGDTGEDRQL
jgi:hypothetical protein